MTTLTTALLALMLAQAPQTLTLGDALKRADEMNLDLKAAQTRVTQAKANVWKAWSGHLLQIGASGAWNQNDRAAVLNLPVGYTVVDTGSTPAQVPPGAPAGSSPTPYVAVPSATYSATIQPRHQIAGQVQASQVLLAPQLWFAIQSAYRAEDAVTYGVENARRDILFGVAQAYYAVASLKRLVDVSLQLQEIAERQSKDAEVRYKAGTIAKVAKLRADIDRSRAEQDVLRAKNNYEGARLALAVLLDRKPDFEVVEPVEPPLPADTSGLEQAALDNRLDLKAARSLEGVYASQRLTSAMRYLPTVAAFGRATYADPAGLTGAKEAWTIGLSLSWTILDGGLREAELRDTSAKIAEAEFSRRALENRAQAEVRNALLDLESARANTKKAKEQRDLAVENQRLVDVSFKAGAATAVEQADATSALLSAEIQYATEALQAQLAAVRVLRASGTFDPGKKG
jgi:outer membrane protein TolC